MQLFHDWLDTALLCAILYGVVQNARRLNWLHEVFTPFMASIPKLIKNNGKDIG
jgi:hypothetical protein